jgi:hypothetical protein
MTSVCIRLGASLRRKVMNRKIRNRLIRGLILGLLVLAIGACTISISQSYIRVANTSSVYTLAHVYITPHSSTSWGSDLLSPAVLTPGSSGDFQLSAGNYDVWVTDTTQPPYDAYAYSVAVGAGSTSVVYFNGTTLAP